MLSDSPPAPHAAFDGMDTPPEPTAVGGDDWEELPNQ